MPKQLFWRSFAAGLALRPRLLPQEAGRRDRPLRLYPPLLAGDNPIPLLSVSAHPPLLCFSAVLLPLAPYYQNEIPRTDAMIYSKIAKTTRNTTNFKVVITRLARQERLFFGWTTGV